MRIAGGVPRSRLTPGPARGRGPVRIAGAPGAERTLRFVRRVAAVAALAKALALGEAHARPWDAEQPWYLEGQFGAVQRGPDGTNLGSGQNYGVHLGLHLRPWMDVGLSLAWAHARRTSLALETSLVSGGIRGRAWAGGGRWNPYGEAGLRLYRIAIEQSSVLAPRGGHELLIGGQVGAGVIYSRSTWWGGLGAELHAAIGSMGFEGNDLTTFTTYNVFIGGPLPR